MPMAESKRVANPPGLHHGDPTLHGQDRNRGFGATHLRCLMSRKWRKWRRRRRRRGRRRRRKSWLMRKERKWERGKMACLCIPSRAKPVSSPASGADSAQEISFKERSGSPVSAWWADSARKFRSVGDADRQPLIRGWKGVRGLECQRRISHVRSFLRGISRCTRPSARAHSR
ncbi:hypothetical protein BCV69DRAFT_188858 [Microstroma glucosiphilum]|uniref:Uncharacterized protein n=1 Tax=Pseudomicrostroma glucosiphilum TaxID=1684307 RepID=A0A316U8H6_9BASI|nr:hypothetical protein BCV69DRAFT_188858 [Pseudomicrostroma glucosiphilum]PWN21154.1 hypothetical protein BCV69DRAFT_188858 [Pseudomicrostroma glucosiphilum]